MITVNLDDSVRDAMARAERMLAGVPGGLEKAMRAAMSRTVQRVRTDASRRVRERYAISAGNLRTEQNVRVRYRYSGGGAEAQMLFSGAKIPTYRFDGSGPKTPARRSDFRPAMLGDHWALVHPGAAAYWHLLRGTSPTRYERAFTATFRSGHTGLFERTGGVTAEGRAEIREIMGLSIPQMIGNEEVLGNLSPDASETFDERMDHEILRVLNGWGG